MTNITDKYIETPMPEGLSRRERRAWVSRQPNPDYIEPELPLTDKDQALIDAGGTLKGKRISFPCLGFPSETIYWNREIQEFHSTGGTMDRDIAKIMRAARIW